MKRKFWYFVWRSTSRLGEMFVNISNYSLKHLTRACSLMKLPKGFTLGAVDWQVVETSPLPGLFGVCLTDKAQIHLDKELPARVKEQTFCHEAVHAILFAMGKTNHDEEFVDAFGTFLHQYLVTAK